MTTVYNALKEVIAENKRLLELIKERDMLILTLKNELLTMKLEKYNATNGRA